VTTGGAPRRRHGRDRAPDVYDIVTPTEREALERDIRRRRRIYLSIMVPCVVIFVFFGLASFLPTPVRVAALCVAAVLPPVAAVLGNRLPR
jgi:Mn2+/Fe2+ NRAMP family transporter